MACSIAFRRCSSASCKYCSTSSFYNSDVICCMLKTLLIYLSFAFMFHSVTNHCNWQMVKGCSLIYQQMWYWMVVVLVMEATCENDIVTNSSDYQSFSFMIIITSETCLRFQVSVNGVVPFPEARLCICCPVVFCGLLLLYFNMCLNFAYSSAGSW